MNKDIKSLLAPVVGLTQQTINTDTTTAGLDIDLQGFNGADVILFTGSYTLGTMTLALLDSDDDVTYTAVADTFLVGTELAAALVAADSVSSVGYVGKKRYLRVTVVSTDSANMVVGAVVVKGAPLKAPV